MPTVVSAMTTHREMPQTITYTTSPTSSHSSRHTSTSSRHSSGSTAYNNPLASSSSVPLHVTKYALGDTKSNSPTGSARFSNYSPTTVSSYRRRMDVEGLPGPKYFSSGLSKTDRRREYVQSPTPPSPVSSTSSSRRSAAGKELIKYRENYDSDEERADGPQDSSDDENFNDSRTLRPGDSISQVSYPSSSTSSKGRRGRRDSAVGMGGGSGSSTFSKISTFQSEQVFDGTRQCYLVERRPRASALAVR